MLSPALTDGSLGDMIFFHSYKNPGLVLDIVEGEARGATREQGRQAGWVHSLTTAIFSRPEAHQHAGHLCQAHWDDHPGRGFGQAPHCQRQPHGEWRRGTRSLVRVDAGSPCSHACVLGLCHVLGRQLWTRQARILSSWTDVLARETGSEQVTCLSHGS